MKLYNRYSINPIKAIGQDINIEETATTVQPDFGQTTVVNPTLLDDNLHSLENINIGPDTKRRYDYNIFLKYLKDLIAKRDDPATQVPMLPPNIKQIWNILAVPKGNYGVDPNIVINILNNVKPHFIGGDQIQKLRDLQRISP